MTSSVSIIIPTHNRGSELQQTLASITKQVAPGLHIEIIVVDNASSDNTAQVVKDYQRICPYQIRYLYESRLGLHFCRHAGAAHSQNEILVYVDDDIGATDGWLAALCRPFEDARVGIVGGKIEPEWAIVPPKWIHTLPPGYLSLLDLGAAAFDMAWPDQVYGCNLAVRRSLLMQVGGFNPDNYADQSLRWLRGDGETGLLLKVYATGLIVRYEPSALVFHRIPPSRLSMSYFRNRALSQGISDGYTAQRAKRFGYFNRLRMTSRKTLVERYGSRLWRVLLDALNGKMPPYRRIDIWCFYFKARIEYVLRFVFDAQLRAHVYRDHYLE